MSIPLDRLYNFLDDLVQEDVLIYRFVPHGSKNLDDLHLFLQNADWIERMTRPIVFVHDQEPLNFDLYSWQDLPSIKQSQGPKSPDPTSMHHIMYPGSPGWASYQHFFEHLNIRLAVRDTFQNIYDQTVLIHSEKNSANVEKYKQKNFLPVYWWCHAAIARDWFRYAEHDPALDVNLDRIQKDFLIYNRAWTGTREYRLKFIELLLQHNLVNDSQITFSPWDQDCYYTDHTYANPAFKISSHNIETCIEKNTADSTASADYTARDYQHTGIEVVLETLFDDHRWHLTEKSLRPMACGRPFMLAATPGSLEYIRSYGFQTFAGLIDESYDTITDPVARLNAIVLEMQRISRLENAQKKLLFEKLYAVADYNKRLFFSQEWHNNVVNELKQNFNTALDYLKTQRTGRWFFARQEFARQYPELEQFSQRDNVTRTLAEYNTILAMLTQNK